MAQLQAKKTAGRHITMPADCLEAFSHVAPSLFLAQDPTDSSIFIPKAAPEDQLFRALFFASSQRSSSSSPFSLVEQDVSGACIGFLANPVHWGLAAPADLVPDTAASVAGILGRLPPTVCTPSQLGQIRQTLDRRLSLLWGPPGTGKTHAISLLCSALAEAHRRPDVPAFHILVVAFTHSAIETLLRRLRELQPDLPIGRLASTRGKQSKAPTDSVTSLSTHSKQPLNFLKKHPVCVVAGTVWAVRSAYSETFRHEPRFELLIADEASQVPAL
jgi:hypothetical protein